MLLLAIQGPVIQEGSGKKDSIMTYNPHSGKVIFILLAKIVEFHIQLTRIYI